MRRTIASVTTPSRWRRRRTVRVAVAGALVVAAPFVGQPASTGPVEAADFHGPSGGTNAVAGPGETPDPRTGSETATDGERYSSRIVPVPLADPAVAELLRPGDLIDLVGTVGTVDSVNAADAPVPDDTADTTAEDGPALVARAARVRQTPAGLSGSRSILVEVPETDAAHLAATAAGTPLAVIVHR